MLPASFVFYAVAIVILTLTMLLVSHVLNPLTPTRSNNYPFESGIVPVGNTDIRWSVNYFLIAISFVIFDIEAVFLYLWSLVVLDTGWPGLFTALFFICALLIALLYETRQHAFDWGKRMTGV
ncbi:NADH-quinone oxidoreductase subunit A [Shewanella salipaludis]|uniref:NADH-quinone oxidoreductase subunit n=1 Tax=Shewanella salipaludis TaxID=2723052 RepID=A0A972FWD8_9GAMM|nr:NADH-quinone oxidoreductase subunit A [Shewanella salipaludis]NMH63857.1 NADH-quinone oxidoreductase subunit A [Shewanella salipaludis]